jgi:hypothetical protein
MLHKQDVIKLLVYTPKSAEPRVLTTLFGLLPLLAYLKMGSNEMFSNMLDITSEEVAVDCIKQVYVLQSTALAIKLICQMYVRAGTPIFSTISLYKASN